MLLSVDRCQSWLRRNVFEKQRSTIQRFSSSSSLSRTEKKKKRKEKQVTFLRVLLDIFTYTHSFTSEDDENPRSAERVYVIIIWRFTHPTFYSVAFKKRLFVLVPSTLVNRFFTRATTLGITHVRRRRQASSRDYCTPARLPVFKRPITVGGVPHNNVPTKKSPWRPRTVSYDFRLTGTRSRKENDESHHYSGWDSAARRNVSLVTGDADYFFSETFNLHFYGRRISLVGHFLTPSALSVNSSLPRPYVRTQNVSSE